ncbi:MAG: type III-B CRISPR module RAMP protein Cmr1 [Deltaproteobacteria bacterium]|nr:type III-B CRISPR module RAMP protein Cmr1 [Deltaproteobacteria bacterium]
MHQIIFELETITPLFMAGADGRTPELRPPSFKGMMRFWWRAMRAEDDIQTLSKNEAILFGGTEEGQGKSKITIRISDHNLKSNSYSPLPHKQARFRVPGLEPRQKFKCIICVEQRYQKVAISAFKLSTLLGGFGKRSRRGFGALCYRKFDDFDEIMEEIEEANNIMAPHKNLC